MINDVNQIYHVARCGSTLLGSLLSTVTTCYLEPQFAHDMIKTGEIPDQYKNTTIKFSSLSLMKPITFTGKKVFLYRPLLHHLYKIKSVDSLWIQHRVKMLQDMIMNDNRFKSMWNPISDMQFIAYQWLVSVSEISNHSDVLWIQTNDFFMDKSTTMNHVCDHFNLPRITDFSIANLNVKQLGINGKNSPCNIKLKPKISFVKSDHGIIKNDECLSDPELVNIITELSDIFPHLQNKFM